jgi:hypothetical protein
VRVEWVVRVPRGVHFLGSTVNGAVSARSMPADATVSSVNGAVTVSAAGVVEASTVNGDIDATTGRADAGRDLQFETVNGDILLRVPADFRARVDAELLNGSIESDFPLEIRRGRYVGATAEGQIGRGGHRLKLETVNGTLEIRRSDGREPAGQGIGARRNRTKTGRAEGATRLPDPPSRGFEGDSRGRAPTPVRRRGSALYVRVRRLVDRFREDARERTGARWHAFRHVGLARFLARAVQRFSYYASWSAALPTVTRFIPLNNGQHRVTR